MAFENLNTKPPEEAVTQEAEGGQEQSVEAQATQTAEGAVAQTEQTVTETVPDEFFDTFNKRFGTSYKDDNEIKSLFQTPEKISEYESKLKEFETVKGESESYKKELNELKNAGYSDLLSKPLIRNAYVAQKLQEKYPDKDPYLLQEIAMSEVDKMDDLDVVAKEQKIRLPKLSLEDIKAAIKSDLGIEPDAAPEEWDSIAKTKLALKAADARDRIKDLAKGIELPKVQTQEEREKLQAEYTQKKTELTKPIKDKFVKFDEYVNGDFKFATPGEFKEKLSGMFDGLFIDAGLEVNEQNLAIAETLKKAMFLEEYFPKIKEVIEKSAQTEIQAKLDEALHNTQLPNTATATDNRTEDTLPGVSKLFGSQTELAKKL